MLTATRVPSGESARHLVSARRRRDRFLVALPVHPHQRPGCPRRAARDVDERALRERLNSAAPLGSVLTDSTTGTGSLKTSSFIGSKRTARSVPATAYTRYPGVDVLGLAPAANQRLALAGRQIQYRHLRVLDGPGRRDGEQDGPAPGQHRREEMILFAVRRIGGRQDRRLPASGGHAEQTGARCAR